MAKAMKVLFVDDLPDWRNMLAGFLSDLGYTVVTASSSTEAQQILQTERFALAIFDVRLDESNESDIEGLNLAKKVKLGFPSLPIMILTGYGSVDLARAALSPDEKTGQRLATSFVGKNEVNMLPALIEDLLRSSHPLFPGLQDTCTLTLSLEAKQPILVRSRGLVAFTYTSANPLAVDPYLYGRSAEGAYQRTDWRFNGKEIGKQLYESIFSSHQAVLSGYHRLLGSVSKEYLLNLCLESSRHFLKVPLEFIFAPELGEYLALKHPISRFVTDAPTRRNAISPDFLNDLWARKDALRVLLIASNTEPPIDGVDDEIRAVETFLQSWKPSHRLECQVDYIPTEQATYERVKAKLRECKYHILHYAGHGSYNELSPEKSCLYFWEKENRQGQVRQMRTSELKLLVENSALRFVYLSCCSSFQSGNAGQLLENDFLGVADGLVYAGVPAVLGFRWPIHDEGAKCLALAFYQSLFEQGNLDAALLHARREIAMADKDDQTWISPVLIVQK